MINTAFASDDAFRRVCDLVDRVGSDPDGPKLVRALAETIGHLGAGSGYYASAVCEGTSIVSLRLLLACKPNWGLNLERLAAADGDAWLRRALFTSEPFCASQLDNPTDADRDMSALAAEHGFRSALIIPIHAGESLPGRRLGRVGLLALGSPLKGFFERKTGPGLRLLARAFAFELHDAYGAMLRRERVRNNKITDVELKLLQLERMSLPTKEMARRVGLTPHAVDNRFYRLALKLGAPDRHSTLRLAVEHGLI